MSRIQCFLVERVSLGPETWARADRQEVNGSIEWPYPALFGPGAIYRDYEGEELVALGSIWRRLGDDGCCWNVILPSGDEWPLDGKSTAPGEGFWSRTGVAPNFTISPSLVDGSRWHGWLTAGFLQEC